MNIIQNGDVLLKKINTIPKGSKNIKSSKYILAHGKNGHEHAILETKKANLFKYNNVLYLKVNEPVNLIHEEHNTLTILPGNYEIDRVKEYDYFAEEIRDIQD